MSKIVNSRKQIKITEVKNYESDEEIELKPKKDVIIPEIVPDIQPIVPVKKTKRPYTMSEETREKKRANFENVRLKKMDNSAQRQREHDALMQREEEELQQKVLKKLQAAKKRREKTLYNKYLKEEHDDGYNADPEEVITVKKARQPKFVEPLYYEPEPEYYSTTYVKPGLQYH
jgi:hypothetical protein